MLNKIPLRASLIWGILIIMVVVVFNIMTDTSIDSSEISFSQFRNAVETGQIEEVTIKDLEVKGTFNEEYAREHHEGKTEFNTVGPVGEDLQDMLAAQQIEFSFDRADEDGVWKTILVTSIPLILLVMVLIFFMRQFQGGGGGRAMTFGKSRARLLNENQNKVTFNDIAGIDEAKEELQEIVEFLKNPKKFTRLGGRIPKGVLLMGSPGTGKTLLARGVAGEAGVPFFSISGSDFVEMFVGVGASRVRDLFEQGKKNAPCIIFIDEIDAVGRHRGSGMGGGHDEREQTLNQLLVEMDGFESNEGVILIAATNRADVLDPALLRPGRFDRRVMVAPPDVRGREQILKIHTRRTPIGKTVDLKDIARGTPGFSGADLENLVNEAALLAARANKDRVESIDFEEAKDKVLMGAERKSIVLTDEEKAVTAYHESGHAIVALRQTNTDPVHKVTIIPRGRALGVTQQLPTKDRYNLNRDYVLERIAVMMGGRAAEELIYNQFTTGAGQDIKVATNLARQMVCEWGMSEAIGPLFYGESQEASLSTTRPYSEDLAREIDAEVRRIVKDAYKRAYDLLMENRELLELMTEALLEFEALDADEIRYLAEEGKLDWIREERQKKMAEEAEEAEKTPKTGFASKIKEQVPPVGPNLAPSNT
ncbi:ATP-dependent zinc metalloprotease FtsH [Lujinxingia sediminis]|nr:ATP-dependent zinc metalloprotease FtsH [Lujinxingia sediminis]